MQIIGVNLGVTAGKAESRRHTMRLTIEQRLAALERETVVLQDTVKLLHRLLRQQRQLINDYITQKVASAHTGDEERARNVRPEEAVYTFRCRQRFDRIDKDIHRLRRLIEDPHLGLKAG